MERHTSLQKAVKAKAIPLLFVVVLGLPTVSCDRKSDPAPTQKPLVRDATRRAGSKVLDAGKSDAGTEIARRIMERERAPAALGAADPDAMMAEFVGATEERRIEILSLLGADGSPHVWDFLCHTANEQDQAMRLAALDALAIHQGGDPSRVIESCLSFPDEETRALAATLLGRRVRDAQVWAKAATDPSPVVRVTYLSAVEAAPVAIKIAAAKRALTSGDPQLRLEAASVLGGAKSKEAAELLIPMLDDPKVADVANDGLFFLLGRYFTSASEARAWLAAQHDLVWE